MRPTLLKFFVGSLLLFMSTIAMADPLSYAARNDGTMLISYFPIILQGETAGAENMFQFISTMAQETKNGDLQVIMALVLGIAFVGTFYRVGMQGVEVAGHTAKEIGFSVIMTVALFFPSVSVTLYDGRDGTGTDLRMVDGVPWFVASTASFTTSIFSNILYVVDVASQKIDGTMPSAWEGLGAPELFALKAIQQIKMDQNISNAINNVTRECFIKNSIDDTIFEFMNSYKTTDGAYASFDAIREIGTKDFMKATTMTNGLTCDAYINQNFSPAVETALNTKITTVLNKLTPYESEKLATIAAQYLAMTDNRTDGYTQTLSNFIGYIKNYQMNGIIAGALKNARAEALGGGDAIATTAEAVSAASVGNLQTSGIGSWKAVTEMMPLAYMHLIVLIWGASILMGYIVLASGYDKGMIILKEYFIGLLTFSTVPIAFALENNHILFYAQENAIGLLSGDYQNPAAMPVIGPHLNYLANMAGMAGAQGLGAAMIIPSIVYGGRVAMAMGMFNSLGGMAANKTPQAVADDAGAERARQKALADDNMRAELAKAGIHVGANSDVGAVYSQYQASLDKAATQFSDAGTYKDNAKRYAAIEAQQFGSNKATIGAGTEAVKTGLDKIGSARQASGAADFTGQIAAGQALIEKDSAGHSAYDATGGISQEYKKGQLTNAVKQVGSVLGAGTESSKHSNADIMSASEAEASESMATSIQRYKTNKDKGLIGNDNIMNDAGRMAIAMEAAKAVDQRIGNMAGIFNNLHDKNGAFSGAYQVNAATSEMSQTQAAYKSIMNKGGIYASVDTDVASAGLSASESQASLKSKMLTLGARGKTMVDMADSIDSKARDISSTQSMKQTDESIGSTAGIKHEFSKHKHTGFQNIAQSSVESQVESGLGAIRGAGGIHKLAWQSGVKSESDSNALKSSIDQAGGAKAYINLNEFTARKGITGTQSDMDAFHDTFGSDGYLGNKGFSGYRLAGTATASKGYAEMKGTANAIGNTGLNVFEHNAQTETENSALSTKRKIEGAGGAQSYITASSTMAASQGAAMISEIAGAGGQNNIIQNAAYSGFQKGQSATSERLQDIANKLAGVNSTTGLTEATDLGSKAIENKAIESSMMKLKDSSKREKAASQFDGIFNALGLSAAENTMKEYGLTKNDLRDGGKHMSAEAYSKFLLNSEKRMEKMEMSVINDRGEMATAVMRNMATKGADGSLNWKSDYETISSFKKQESGQQRNDHLWDSVTAGAKDLAYHHAPGTAATVGTAFEGVAAAVGASVVYDNFIKNFSSTGAKAKMNNGGMAMKDADGSWYAIDEEGKYIENDGKRVNADKKLKPLAKSAWDKGRDAAYAFKDYLGGALGEQPVNESSGNDNSKANNGVNDKAHGGTPSSDMSNSTTSGNSTQGSKAEMYRAEQKSKIDAAFGRTTPLHEPISHAESTHIPQSFAERALGYGGKVLNAVSSGAKILSSALIDGTAFNPTSLGEGSDVLPQRGTTNQNVIAMQQAYAHASTHAAATNMYTQQAQYAHDTRYSGTYPHIQAAMSTHPQYSDMAVNRSMMSGIPVQTATIGDTMRVTAEQTLQMRHNSQVQAEHIRETSRSMSEMVSHMSDLTAFFENLMGMKEGKVNPNA